MIYLCDSGYQISNQVSDSRWYYIFYICFCYLIKEDILSQREFYDRIYDCWLDYIYCTTIKKIIIDCVQMINWTLAFVFSGGKFITVGDKIRLPDDVTMGYIIEYLLKKQLTVVEQFHSHLEPMKFLNKDTFHEQVISTFALFKFYFESKVSSLSSDKLSLNCSMIWFDIFIYNVISEAEKFVKFHDKLCRMDDAELIVAVRVQLSFYLETKFDFLLLLAL